MLKDFFSVPGEGTCGVPFGKVDEALKGVITHKDSRYTFPVINNGVELVNNLIKWSCKSKT